MLEPPPVPEPIADFTHVYEVTEEERLKIAALADDCLRQFPDIESKALYDQVGVRATELPIGLIAAVEKARLAEPMYALIIRGLKISTDLEPTPAHWREADTPNSRHAAMQLVLISALLGSHIGWRTQQDGALVTNVLPIRGQEQSDVSSSSTKELGWHVEDAFSPFRADYVGLLCLRTPSPIATTVAAVDPNKLPVKVVEILQEPRFITRPDTSHAGSNNSASTDDRAFKILESQYDANAPRVPVLDGPIESAVLRIDRDFSAPQPGDDEAAEALDEVTRHLDDRLTDLPLVNGDVAFLDNRNVVHGRRAFEPRHDGTDRWLKRVNVVQDLRRTRPGRAPDSRIIGPVQ